MSELPDTQGTWPPDFTELATDRNTRNGSAHGIKPITVSATPKMRIIFCTKKGLGHACVHLPFILTTVPEPIDFDRWVDVEDNEEFSSCFAPFTVPLPDGGNVLLVVALARITGVNQIVVCENQLHIDLWETHTLSDIIDELMGLICLATDLTLDDFKRRHKTLEADHIAEAGDQISADDDPAADLPPDTDGH